MTVLGSDFRNILEFPVYLSENISSEFKMEIRKEVQNNPVADETSALFAVIRPILSGLLNSTSQEALFDAGGIDNIKLRQLSGSHINSDGDIGICFEYAIHESILNHDSRIQERIESALKICKIRDTSNIDSLLFGMEKEREGSLQIIKSIKENLTNDSRLLYGSRGQPVKLKKHIDSVAAAFRKSSVRNDLPTSINGLWKADLFIGNHNSEQWVGTTVKINPKDLEGARGLRVAIIPAKQGKKDGIFKDENKHLVIVPLPYDNSFMEIFLQGWNLVKQFLSANSKVPKEVNLFNPADRYVAKQLEGRRDFPVLDVIDALLPISQPQLIKSNTELAEVSLRRGNKVFTDSIIAPIPKM